MNTDLLMAYNRLKELETEIAEIRGIVKAEINKKYGAALMTNSTYEIDTVPAMLDAADEFDSNIGNACCWYKDNVRLVIDVLDHLYREVEIADDFENIILAKNGPTPTSEGFQAAEDLIKIWESMHPKLRERFHALLAKKLDSTLWASSPSYVLRVKKCARRIK